MSSTTSGRTLSIIELTAKKNPFTGAKNLPDPPRPDENRIPRNLPAVEQVPFIQQELNSLSYNHLPHTFFCLEKHRTLENIISTGKEALAEALPIRCLEATFVGLYLTQQVEPIHRIPLSFGSWVGSKYYSHIVLVLYIPCPTPRFGAIGLSRKSTLMYKPMTYTSLTDLVMDYKHHYEVLGHKLSDIRLGLTFSHQTPCFRQPCWRFVAVKLSSFIPKRLRNKSKSPSSNRNAAPPPVDLNAVREEPSLLTESTFTPQEETTSTTDGMNGGAPLNVDADVEEKSRKAPASTAETPDEIAEAIAKDCKKYEELNTFLLRYVRLLPLMSEQYNKASSTDIAGNRSVRMCYADLDEIDGDARVENKRRIQLIDALTSPLAKESISNANAARHTISSEAVTKKSKTNAENDKEKDKKRKTTGIQKKKRAKSRTRSCSTKKSLKTESSGASVADSSPLSSAPFVKAALSSSPPTGSLEGTAASAKKLGLSHSNDGADGAFFSHSVSSVTSSDTVASSGTDHCSFKIRSTECC